MGARSAQGRFFILACLLAGTATLAVLAVAGLPILQHASRASVEVAQTLAPLVAAAACLWAARQVSGSASLAWTLLALSAGIWAAGELQFTIQSIFLGEAMQFPSWNDLASIAAVPFAVAAIRAFWAEPRGTPSRWRVWLDASIIALSLTFTAWTLGLRSIWLHHDPPLQRFFELAYPVGDILVGTVLILALRRATSRQHLWMFLLLGGVGANSLSDSAFAYLSVTGSGSLDGSALDVGWVAGYLLIALAAVAPRSVAQPAPDEAPVDLWQLALPWITVGIAGASALFLVFTRQRLDTFLTALTGAGAILLSLNMILTNRDFLRMLLQSRASEATVSEVISQAPVGVVRIGADMRILDANPPFAALMRAEGSQVGRPVRSYFRGADASRFSARLMSLRGETRAAEDDIEARHPDGSTTWMHWSATAVKGAGGEVLYFVAMFEDTTARHREEAAAAKSLEVLERLNRLKSEFLQNVSHEFKTALIGIQGFSELMRDADELDVSDARAFASDIYRDAERLDRMVTEMLALDRAESTRANLRIARVDMGDVIRGVVEASRQDLESYILVLELGRDLPAVAGDEEKLASVVRTLLDNAVKRSQEGGSITVSASSDGGGVEVCVKDLGVRMSSAFDSRLFGEDDLYANSPILKVVSTELGLGIARQIVEMHGGRLWLGGLDAAGSEIHFNLPVLWRDREGPVS